MAFVFPSNCYAWRSPAFLEMAEAVRELLVFLCLHAQPLLYLLKCLYLNPGAFSLLPSWLSAPSHRGGSEQVALWCFTAGWGYTTTTTNSKHVGSVRIFWENHCKASYQSCSNHFLNLHLGPSPTSEWIQVSESLHLAEWAHLESNYEICNLSGLEKEIWNSLDSNF